MQKFWYHGLLLGTVCTTGAFVLILEVLAIRQLSPQFGTSMFVVSSVLTVVLAALALGYFCGGRLADRYPQPLLLYFILTTGGCAVALSYLLGKLLLPLGTTIFSITSGPLFFSLLLFFIPAFILGIDSPFVIKLLTEDAPPESAGTITGTTFFWSTVGSIAGSLSAGFFFIPFVGIEYTILGVAVVLSLGSTVAGWLITRYHASPDTTSPTPIRLYHLGVVTMVTLVIVAGALGYEKPSLDGPNQTTLYEADGYYGHIRIYDEAFSLTRPPARFLRREVNAESAIFQDSYDHPFEYTRFADLYPTLRTASTTNMLLLGGGAYSVARSILANDSKISVDVVELEPLLWPLAQEYFDLPTSPRLKNYLMDARVFVQTATATYDYIFMDTFNSGLYIPPHLTTQEYWHAVRKRLSPDGLLIVNFIGARGLGGTTLTDSFYKTLLTTFPNSEAFVMDPLETRVLQNIIFIADRTDTPLSYDHISIIGRSGSSTPLTSLAVSLSPVNPSDQVIFTDDRSSAEYLVAAQLQATKNAR